MGNPDRDRIITEQMGWTQLLNDDNHENKDWLDEYTFEEYEEGKTWKRLTGYEPTDFDQFEELPLYQKAHDFAVDAKKMVNSRFRDRQYESIKPFAQNVTIPAAKVAGGFAFVFERESYLEYYGRVK